MKIIKHFLFWLVVVVVSIFFLVDDVKAQSVFLSNTPETTFNNGAGGDSTSGEYTIQTFNVGTQSYTFTHINFSTAESQEISGSNNMEWVVINSSGVVVASTTTINYPATPSDTEFTITWDNPVSVSGLFAVGWHYNSGTGIAPAWIDGNTYALGCADRSYPIGTALDVWTDCDDAEGDDDIDIYFRLFASGFSGNLDNIGVGPSFISINHPAEGSFTASTTVAVDVDYFIDSEFHSADEYTTIYGQFCSIAYNAPCEKFTIGSTGVEDVLTNATTTINLGFSGAYLGMVSLWNGVSEDVECKWWQFFCDEQEIKILGTATTRFNSATTTLPVILPFENISISSFCDDSSWSVQSALCRLMIWLWIPDSDTFEKWKTLDNQLEDKLPFSMFLSVRNELGTLTELDDTEDDFYNLQFDLSNFEPFGGFPDPSAVDIINLSDIAADPLFEDLYMSEDSIFTDIGRIFIWFMFIVYIWRRVVGQQKPV